MRERRELAGQIFGGLTVIKLAYIKDHKSNWECKCVCGKIVIKNNNNITRGFLQSCGCLMKEYMKKSSTTNGLSRTRFSNIHQSIKKRCNYSKEKTYKNYGGRGITYQLSWGKIENFKEDMYQSYLEHVEKYGEKQTSIDRIDVNGNYTKENCRWQTLVEQQNNKRNNHIIEYKGEKMTITEMARKYNVERSLFNGRLRIGWSIERAITEPLNHYMMKFEKLKNEREVV